MPQAICDVSTFVSSGSWSLDNVIIFGDLTRGVMRVPASGGMSVALTALAHGESFQGFPVFLPDGRHFLYHRSGGPEDVNGIYVGSIDVEPAKQDARRLLALPQVVQVVSLGDNKVKLVYLREGTLIAQDFDAAKLKLTGEAAIVAEQVGNSLVFGFHAASPNTLAYRCCVQCSRKGFLGRLLWKICKRIQEGFGVNGQMFKIQLSAVLLRIMID